MAKFAPLPCGMVDVLLLLQVVSEEGAVSGLLSIAKCLYDAIHRLEKKAAKVEEDGGGGGMSDEKQELAASLLKVICRRLPSSVATFVRARFGVDLSRDMRCACHEAVVVA